MSVTDAPDWQKVVVTVASGGVTQDAPDWQNTVVSPGGTPVGGGQALDRVSVANIGWPAWTYPSFYGATAVGLTSGTVFFSHVVAYQSKSVNDVVLAAVNATAVTYTADESYVGIYVFRSPLFELVASSAAGTFESYVTVNGINNVPLSAAYQITEGDSYYVAVLVNASVGPLQVTGISLPAAVVGNPTAAPGITLEVTPGPYTALPASIGHNFASVSQQPWLALY